MWVRARWSFCDSVLFQYQCSSSRNLIFFFFCCFYSSDFRTHVSGVTAADIRANKGAMKDTDCRQKVAELLKGKVLVGHALKNDLHALLLTHPKADIRDTAKYRPFQRLGGNKWRPRKLRDLVKENLGLAIQQEGQAHDSTEDAKATMMLFRSAREQWERELEEKASLKKRKTT